MEDSGIDSDNKPLQNGTASRTVTNNTSPSRTVLLEDEDTLTEIHLERNHDSEANTQKKTSELQRKLADKQREAARRAQRHGSNIVDNQPKKGSLLSRNRVPKYSKLIVPAKQALLSPDQQPLVMLDTDDSDDEFGLFSSRPNAEIAEQLIRDGYDLDLAPDDEDLDLIPPRPLSERCGCCTSAHLTTCVLQ